MTVFTNKWKIPFEIEDEDYEIISHYSWYLYNGYPTTGIRTYYNGICIGGRIIRLHQLLMGFAPEGLEWDHIDRNKLNNRRDNFRLVTSRVNQYNKNLQSNNKTGYKGVSPNNRTGGFNAQIHDLNGKGINLGRYETIEEAIKARKEGEKKYWGISND